MVPVVEDSKFNMADYESYSSVVSSSRKSDGNEDENKTVRAKSFKKRYRGKRKPESRRRVRPGKSRSGFVKRIGAPFNDNDYLISQRNWGVEEREEKLVGEIASDRSGGDSLSNNNSSHISGETCENCPVCLPSPTILERSSDNTGSGRSDGGGETSDYSSLHSPADSCRNFGNDEREGEDCLNYNSDEIFDEEFERRNFEADYSAQERELREELLKVPRYELEEKYFVLLNQTRDLEERAEESRRLQELEDEIRYLEEENKRLRMERSDSVCPSPPVERC